MNVRYRVELNQAERSELTTLLSGGKHAVRKLKRAQILLAADAGASDEKIATNVGASPPRSGSYPRSLPGNDSTMPQGPASNGCSQPKKPAPRWAALTQPRCHLQPNERVIIPVQRY